MTVKNAESCHCATDHTGTFGGTCEEHCQAGQKLIQKHPDVWGKNTLCQVKETFYINNSIPTVDLHNEQKIPETKHWNDYEKTPPPQILAELIDITLKYLFTCFI